MEARNVRLRRSDRARSPRNVESSKWENQVCLEIFGKMECLRGFGRNSRYIHPSNPFALVYTDLAGPTTPYTTVKHGDWKHVGYASPPTLWWYETECGRYTCIWNILDYSAVSFPTGFVADKEIDLLPSSQQSFGELDSAVRSKCMKLPCVFCQW